MDADAGTDLNWLKLAIFWLSYLYFPATVLIAWIMFRVRFLPRALFVFFWLGITGLAYARFIEPQQLHVMERAVVLERCVEDKGELRLAVVADPHIGLFRNAISIDRIAGKLNDLDADAVLIAGDFTYHLDEAHFDAVFAPIGRLSAPVFGVLGNHDVGLPGPDVSATLAPSLSRIGMQNIENKTKRFFTDNADVDLVGLPEFLAMTQDRDLLLSNSVRPRILLVHNPDTVFAMGPHHHFDLMIAGHTHGGQINLGPLTCVIASMACRVVREGFKQTPRGLVFVTAGTGMVNLPFRFLVPPRIDVLNITYEKCRKQGEARNDNP